MRKLDGKVAIVTGSSRGIGKFIALEFAREGADVVVNYNKSEKEAREVAKQIEKLGQEALLVKADISKPEEVKALIEKTYKHFKRVDILVNNAGVVEEKEISELSFKDWEKTLHTNLIGTFLACKEVMPIMKKQKLGKIINIASIRGLEHAGRAGVLDYSASKAGVINLTKSLARELGPRITINSVSPGWTKTEMNLGLPKDFEKEETGKIPLKRFAEPEEIAKAVLFLASSDADYITGQNLIVDGGRSLN
ncbi:MAG TPA: 3-oxoacyl-ACP reductase family protein [archaeon]|nr:3-oxoacyl-ACP reductase family protein [archaeon]